MVTPLSTFLKPAAALTPESDLSHVAPLLRQTVLLNPVPGIVNRGGNDCWINSLLQMAASTPSLKHMLSSIANSFTRNGDRKNLVSLQAVLSAIEQLENERSTGSCKLSTLDTRELRPHLYQLFPANAPLDLGQQGEAAGVLDAICPLYAVAMDYQPPQITTHKPLAETGNTQTFRQFFERKTNKPNLTNIEEVLAYCSEGTSDISLLQRDKNADIKVIYIDPNSHPNFVNTEIQSFYRAKDAGAYTPETLEAWEKTLSIAFFQNWFSNIYQEPARLWYFDPNKPTDAEGHFILREYTCDGERRTFTEAPLEFFFNLDRASQSAEGAAMITIERTLYSEHIGQTYLSQRNYPAPMQHRFTLSANYTGGEEATYELDGFLAGGSINGGHFKSYQKINGEWYFLNDSVTTLLTEDDLREAMQSEGSLYHYTKLAQVDPNCIKVGSIPDSARALENFRTRTPPLAKGKYTSDQLISDLTTVLEWIQGAQKGSEFLPQLPIKLKEFICKVVQIGLPTEEFKDLLGQPDSALQPLLLRSSPPLFSKQAGPLMEQLQELCERRIEILQAKKECDEYLTAVNPVLSTSLRQSFIKESINPKKIQPHYTQTLDNKRQSEGSRIFNENPYILKKESLLQLIDEYFDGLGTRLINGCDIKNVEVIHQLLNPDDLNSADSISLTENSKKQLFRLVFAKDLYDRLETQAIQLFNTKSEEAIQFVKGRLKYAMMLNKIGNEEHYGALQKHLDPANLEKAVALFFPSPKK
ncbi:MAG: hypothetical protein EBZ47_01450 [Chlamydiae bacterium]|nr:hypothetical protein [Chlamydiota bacterium]